MAKLLVSNTKQRSKDHTFYSRRIARSVAKANMRRAGVPRINKNFAPNWRDWVIVKEKRRFRRTT